MTFLQDFGLKSGNTRKNTNWSFLLIYKIFSRSKITLSSSETSRLHFNIPNYVLSVCRKNIFFAPTSLQQHVGITTENPGSHSCPDMKL